MKEFSKTQKVTYNLMSFTGFKGLLIFSMLIDGPKSYQEICDAIENHPYLREKISIDTMRVYINSLKRIGCEVKRVRGNDKISRYVITSHPFELKFTPEQLKSAIRVYKTLAKNMDVKDLLYMSKFFEKIGNYIKDEDFIAEIKKISLLRGIDTDLLELLIDCCDKNLQIVIRYNSPKSGEKDIEMIANKIEILNGKIYLNAFGFEYMQYGIFLVNRILNVKEIKSEKTEISELNKFTIQYELFSPKNPPILTDNEKITTNNGDYYTIEANTDNKFLLIQRLLELGPSCKVITPEDFKEEFIQLLQDMKAGYYFG